jgi:hypothetical protein
MHRPARPRPATSTPKHTSPHLTSPHGAAQHTSRHQSARTSGVQEANDAPHAESKVAYMSPSCHHRKGKHYHMGVIRVKHPGLGKPFTNFVRGDGDGCDGRGEGGCGGGETSPPRSRGGYRGMGRGWLDSPQQLVRMVIRDVLEWEESGESLRRQRIVLQTCV